MQDKLPQCGFSFWNDAMSSRNGSNRFVRAVSTTSSKTYGDSEQKECGEGRVVEALGHVSTKNRWCLFVPTGPLPPARAKHAALSIGRRMFVLGGASADGVLDDVQVFHAERAVWLQLGCGSVPSLFTPSKSIPPDARGPRCVGHCLAFWETKLLVLGGRIEPNSQKLKAFALDLQSQAWSILAPEGEVPVARTGQSVVQVGSALILFGGEDSKGQMLNDVYLLDLKTLIWRPVKTSGPKPSPRRSHSAACYDERYMFIFGGKAHGNYHNDMYYLDLQNMEWTKEKPKGMVPASRAGHAGAIVGSIWYIVGGELRGHESLDTLAFDLQSRSWAVITTVQPGTPLANDGLSVVKARNKGRTFLLAFGGHGAILSNQVFVMMVANSNRNGPREPEMDDLSTSSLPFSYTSGSLRTMQPFFDCAQMSEVGQLGFTYKSTSEEKVDDVGSVVEEKVEHDVELDRLGLLSNETAGALSNGSLSMEASTEAETLRARDARLYKEMSDSREVENPFKRVLKEKEGVEKQLEEALSTIDGLQRDVDALVESRIEGDRRLRAAHKQLDRYEIRLNAFTAAEAAPNNGGDSIHLRQQLEEFQQHIVSAVRKQVLAERKLLGALKENRELRKKLLHAREETKVAESS